MNIIANPAGSELGSPTTTRPEEPTSLDRYEEAIISQSKVRDTLLSILHIRDEVAKSIADDPALANAWMPRLVPLDQELQKSATAIKETIWVDGVTPCGQSLQRGGGFWMNERTWQNRLVMLHFY